jgi:peptide/nickel transport system ATP-binding protein
MSTPLLAVDGLTISVHRASGDQVLVRDLSLHLAPGESIGLVGESGSGKSLTAKALVSLLPAGVYATGSVVFDGVTIDLAGRSAHHRGASIALLMQDPFTMLNPMMTAGEHVAETLLAAGTPRRSVDAEVTRRLAEVDITDASVAHRYPFELSGGMSQRVALAAALANDPAVLVADEPTTALDATTQHDVLELLRQIQRDRSMGLVLITHDLRLAFSVCDRVMVMYAGSIAEVATAPDIRSSPRHPYTAGLLASVPSVEHYQADLRGIAGSVPATHTVADRCAFAARCTYRQHECETSRPPLVEIVTDRWTSCRRAGELGQLLDAPRLATSRPATTPSSGPVLTVESLRKTYRIPGGEHVALQGVSFEVGMGEALGIVGESGSGKTTIARCILDLTTATAGRIVLDGIDISRRKALDRSQRRAATQRLQCVFQDPYSTLNPMHTVEFVLAEALAHGARDVVDRNAAIGSLLERVGLAPELSRRRPSALSGGQRQRVAIARALAMDPKVLVCDEPVAALDVSVQAQILELLRDLNHTNGTSLLFITHDLGVVRQITDRVLVLYKGEVVEHGDTDRVLNDPQHEYTQRLVASMPSVPGNVSTDPET